MRGRTAQLALTIVCVALGALLMIQFRTQGNIAKSLLAESATDHTTIISNLYESNLTLRREVGKLTAQSWEYEREHDEGKLNDMVQELNQLRILTGQSEVTGPGVQLTVQARLRAEDVLDLINELRNAGAEALTVGDQRVVARTAVRTYHGQIVVNDTVVESPFVFRAIGNPETLDRALTRKGGLLAYLQNAYPAATISLSQESSLVLPVYAGSYTWNSSQIVEP